MLCVLPPTDKNLSFLLPVFHKICSNVAKPAARFCCPHRNLKEIQTKQNSKMQDCKEDWKDVFKIQHGCYEHRF